jgi:tetratricopeptide (TPR) repeat protein
MRARRQEEAVLEKQSPVHGVARIDIFGNGEIHEVDRRHDGDLPRPHIRLVNNAAHATPVVGMGVGIDHGGNGQPLADVLLKAGKTDAAREQAVMAVMLAESEGPAEVFAAHEMAARVALVSGDKEAATEHAAAAHEADPSIPVQQFVQGRLLYEEGKYEQAATTFAQATTRLTEANRSLADLHLYLGESLARLDRYDEAESQFREELRDFPRSIQAYTSLAMLYRASNRDAAVEDVLNELVASTPTPEGYGVAARLWTILGDPSRAEALRSDARTRFRGDPSLALLGRGGR